jgi:hypothetical protein
VLVDDLLDKMVWDSCDNAESCSPSSVLCGIIRSDFGMREYFCDKRRNLLCKNVSFFARSYQLKLAKAILRVALNAYLEEFKSLSVMKVCMCKDTI